MEPFLAGGRMASGREGTAVQPMVFFAPATTLALTAAPLLSQ